MLSALFYLAASFGIFSPPATAVTGSAIQGTLFAPDGTLVVSNNVTFKVQIFDKDLACVLYEEMHYGVNLSQSLGAFSLILGSGTNRANRIDGSIELKENVFRNDVNLATFAGCPTGVNFNKGDVRLARVSFDLGSGFVALTPEMKMLSSPYASVASTLEGKAANEFVQIRDDASFQLNQDNVESVFSSTNFSRLMALLNGTSTQYLPANSIMPTSINGQRLTNMAAPIYGSDGVNKEYADSRIGGKEINLTSIGPAMGDKRILQWDAAAGGWTTAEMGITALSGDVLASGSGPVVATINNSAVTTAKLANNSVTSAKISSAGVAVNRILITDGTTGSSLTYLTCPNVNEVMAWTALGWQCRSVVSLAPVTSVAGKTGAVSLNFNDIDGLGTAAVKDYGTSAGQLVELDSAARIPAVDGGLLTNVNATRLSLYAVSSNAPQMSNVLSWNGTEWTPTPVNSVFAFPITGTMGTAAAPTYSFAGDTGTGIFTPASGVLAASVLGAERLRIESNGNVGIDTTAPADKLTVNGSIRMLGATSGYTGLKPAADAGSTMWTLPNTDGGPYQVLTTDGDGNLSWTSPNSGTWSGTIIHPAYGGSGLDASNASDGQILIGNGSGFALSTITGTTNQVNVTNGPGSITLSTPQDIHTGASPTFVGMTLSGMTSAGIVKNNASGVLSGGNSIILTNDVTGILPIANGGTGSNNGSITGSGALVFAAGGSNENVTITPSGTGSTLLNGNVGIGTNTPGAPLDVKGQIRMSGATSGYTGFQPAAAAGSTIYTLPNADGSSGFVLSTDGAGNLSWVANTTNSVTAVTASAPLASSGGFTPNISISQSNASTDGYLSSTDWNTFNNKSPAQGSTNITTLGTVTTGTWNADIIQPAYGGTGLNASTASNGQLLIGNGSGFSLATLTGTTNQVNVTNSAGGITLSTPQDIHSGANPTFAGINITSMSTAGIVKNNASGALAGGNSVILTTDVSGILPVANGGTGTSTGSITGTGALTFAAGGANQNVTLTPSGTGYTVLNGNVGIGTASPSYMLHVNNSSASGSLAVINTAGTGELAAFIGENHSGADNATRVRIQDTTGGVQWFMSANNDGAFAIYQGSVGDRLNLTSAGNVGIGVTNPSTKLDVGGAINIRGPAGGSTALSVPVGATSNITYTLPPTDGSAGTVLSTNGSGTLTWVANTANSVTAVTASAPLASSGGFTPNITLAQATTSSDGYLSSTDWNTFNNKSPAAGSTNITTLGTITTGTWNGSVIGTAYGGTGLNASAASNGQLLIGNGSGFTLATITGTANRVSVTNSAGGITLSAPQDIHTAASPTFAGMTVSGALRTNVVSGASTSISSASVDFSNANAVSNSFDCAGGNLTLNSIRDGGSYVLVITSASTAQCTFNTSTGGTDAATVTYRFNAANGSRAANSHTIYNLTRVGTIIYISWATGF